MNIAAPEFLWPFAISGMVLLALARWKCVELAEGYAKFVFGLVSIGLPTKAKEDWRNEALWHIIELISSDRCRGLSREAAALNAVISATTLLAFGWQDRAFYLNLSSSEERGALRFLHKSTVSGFQSTFAYWPLGIFSLYRVPAWFPGLDWLVYALVCVLWVWAFGLPTGMSRRLRTQLARFPGPSAGYAWPLFFAPLYLRLVLLILGFVGLPADIPHLIPVIRCYQIAVIAALLPTWARWPARRLPSADRPD